MEIEIQIPKDWFERNWVYIFESLGLYKIGFSRDYEQRLEGMRTSNPHDIKLHSVYRVPNARAYEAKLHSIFNPKRVAREWFQLDSIDIELVERLLTQKAHG